MKLGVVNTQADEHSGACTCGVGSGEGVHVHVACKLILAPNSGK